MTEIELAEHQQIILILIKECLIISGQQMSVILSVSVPSSVIYPLCNRVKFLSTKEKMMKECRLCMVHNKLSNKSKR